MRLKEKTHRKFIEFFEKVSSMYNGEEFELAYSDIQRETGAASVTLKRAIQALAEDGAIVVLPGRNSRYARFKFILSSNNSENQSPEMIKNEKQLLQEPKSEEIAPSGEVISENVLELTQLIDHLRRRVRNQEMAIALLQDRFADLEDKILKR